MVCQDMQKTLQYTKQCFNLHWYLFSSTINSSTLNDNFFYSKFKCFLILKCWIPSPKRNHDTFTIRYMVSNTKFVSNSLRKRYNHFTRTNCKSKLWLFTRIQIYNHFSIFIPKTTCISYTQTINYIFKVDSINSEFQTLGL